MSLCCIIGCGRKCKAYGYYQAHYSEPYIKCACCGEKNLCFLTLDHIIPIKRKTPNVPSGTHLFYKLKKLGFPKGFQVLCYNCNCAKRDNKDCPHKIGGGV